ncbi:MAG TPA: metallophosphoesterase, partial [Armatimonadota bacterium]|nr:metallophosphoesterase [Armatimonadota bacterium]
TLDCHAPDLLLCAGDWGDPGEVPEKAIRALTRRVRLLTVYGNHDDRHLLGRVHNKDGSPILLPQGGTRRVGKITVAGVSGIWAKTRLGSRLNARWESAHRRNPSLTLDAWMKGKELPPYVTDDDVAQLAGKLARRRIDIMVRHACPSGLADRTPQRGRGGQRCFRRLVDIVRPSLTLCGHLHALQRDDTRDGRIVLNTGYGASHQGWLIHRNARHWECTPLPGVEAAAVEEES